MCFIGCMQEYFIIALVSIIELKLLSSVKTEFVERLIEYNTIFYNF